MKKVKLLLNCSISLFIYISLMGCSLLFPSDSIDEKHDDPVLIQESNNFDTNQVVAVPKQATNNSGQVGFSTTDYDSLDLDVQLEIENETGDLLEGLEISTYIVDGNLMAAIHDPAGIYADTLIQVDTRDYNSSANISTGRFILTIATGILVVKVVAVLFSAVALGFATKNLIEEMHDFHIDNFQDISWKTLTYKATISEIIDLLLDAGDFALSAISCEMAIGSLGTTTIISSGQALKLVTSKLTHLARDVWIDAILYYVKEVVEYADLNSVGIDEDTEVFVKVNFLPLGLLGEFDSAIEIIPILDDSYNQLNISELVGKWCGNYNVDGEVGEASLEFRNIIDSDTIECVLNDTGSQSTTELPLEMDIDGYTISGLYIRHGSFSPEEDTLVEYTSTVDFKGAVTGNNIILNYTSSMQIPQEYQYLFNIPLVYEGTFTGRKM